MESGVEPDAPCGSAEDGPNCTMFSPPTSAEISASRHPGFERREGALEAGQRDGDRLADHLDLVGAT